MPSTSAHCPTVISLLMPHCTSPGNCRARVSRGLITPRLAGEILEGFYSWFLQLETGRGHVGYPRT